MGDLSTIKPFKDELITEKKDKIGWQFQKWLDILWKALDGALTIGGIALFAIQEDPVATTSGTSVTLTTSIASWARLVRGRLSGVSVNGTAELLIQLVTAAGPVVVGYTGGTTRVLAAAATTGAGNTTGFRLTDTNAAAALTKSVFVLELHDEATNTWIISSIGSRDSGATYQGSGTIALPGPLTGMILTTTGADTFDAGSVSVRYEY